MLREGPGHPQLAQCSTSGVHPLHAHMANRGHPSMSQKELVKGAQMCFSPAGVKIKSKAGKQRGWIGFLRNLQRHFILNRILTIMMSNVMLVPTESTRAIKFKHENRRHTGPQEIPWDLSLMVSFPPYGLLW